MNSPSDKILIAVCNYFNPDNRVFRTADTLQKAGYEVVVLSYFAVGLSEEEKPGSGFTLKRIKVSDIKIPGRQIRNFLNQLLWKNEVLKFAYKFKPQYVHCNDYNTLFLGKYCRKKFKSKIVYDNHEYFQDLKYLHRYPLIVRKWIANFEKKALKQYVDEMIVVSPGIAEAYFPIFKKKVHVIRNIPDLSEMNNKTYTIPENITNFLTEQKRQGRRLFLYLGTNTQKGRGMDFTFKLISALSDTYGLVVFGAKNENELKQLNQRAIEEGISGRFGAFTSIPVSALSRLSSYFYMGLSLIEPIFFSYKYSLPNKLFEYFSMGLPVLSSEIPDQAKIVLHHNLGLVIPFDITVAKETLLSSAQIQYNSDMKSIFTWETEKDLLLELYKMIK